MKAEIDFNLEEAMAKAIHERIRLYPELVTDAVAEVLTQVKELKREAKTHESDMNEVKFALKNTAAARDEYKDRYIATCKDNERLIAEKRNLEDHLRAAISKQQEDK